jgi:4-hydroxybenzoate polyprenyltransferase and related prenyltransferases
MKIKYYIKEMRVHHYIKNILVLMPLACSGKLLNTDKLTAAGFAFASFCLVSSAIYFINDIADVEKDRKHPTKCKRPIAAGDISKRAAVVFAVFLIAFAGLCNAFSFHVKSTLLLALYLLINICYSFGLKNVPLLDIALLVSGFVIRALYGSVVTDIHISNWLYFVIISGAFYLGLGKRRNEHKKQSSGDTRNVIAKYPLAFLDGNMNMLMGLMIVFYALWTVDSRTVEAYHSARLIWTVPVVMLIFLKYSLTVEGDSDGDPVEVLIHDKVLVCFCLAYMLIMFMMLYVFR